MPQASSTSYWQATASPSIDYPPLSEDVETDVAIVGGGITGLTAAMHLKAAGRKVVLVEARRIGGGTTGRTSGHLDALPDNGLEQLVDDFGKMAARAVTQARMEAIGQIEAWCGEYAIECDFRRIPAFMYSESANGAGSLRVQDDIARELGLDATIVEPFNLPFENTGGLHVQHQARFHAQRYLQALAGQVHGDGCVIHEQTQAHPPTEGEPCMVETPGGRIYAPDVILATHSAFLGISSLDLRIAPYQSYVLAARVADEVPDVLFWDDQQPYHYGRLASSDDPKLVLIGGSDHKTGQGDPCEALDQLEQYARQRFTIEAIEHRWSAELFEPSDGLPQIGLAPTSNHLYAAAGYSGTGLTFGTMAGRVLTDLLLKKASAVAENVSPSRVKPLAAGGRFLTENLNVARRLVMDRFKARPIESLEEIRDGEGCLVRYHGDNWAVYRDPHGALHVFSPTCTHAGCQVQWNAFESTWDCPCHGGRFSALGKRLYGPPAHDLEQKGVDELSSQ